jgi:hypothetical protein
MTEVNVEVSVSLDQIIDQFTDSDIVEYLGYENVLEVIPQKILLGYISEGFNIDADKVFNVIKKDITDDTLIEEIESDGNWIVKVR